MDVISYPFRLTSNGSVAKVTQGSDADLAQKLAGLVQTAQGELPLAPHYGISDPVFHAIDKSEVIAAAAIFYPELQISDVTSRVTDTGRTTVEVSFTAASQEEQNA